MEIGAGLGFCLRIVPKLVGSENTYAFEANIKLEPVIRDTYQLNGVSPLLGMRVLSHQAGVRTFYLDENLLVSSLTSACHRAGAMKVPAKPINAGIARIRPSMLIIDIEGGEFELFPEIDLLTIQKIVMKLHPSSAEREKPDH